MSMSTDVMGEHAFTDVRYEVKNELLTSYNVVERVHFRI